MYTRLCSPVDSRPSPMELQHQAKSAKFSNSAVIFQINMPLPNSFEFIMSYDGVTQSFFCLFKCSSYGLGCVDLSMNDNGVSRTAPGKTSGIAYYFENL